MEYNGRYQLDAASLDRFAIIHINYSSKIENALADGDQELIEFVHDFRKATDNAGIYCICSYRTIERIKKLENLFEIKDILKMSLIKNLNEDDLRVLRSRLTVENKYALAV